MPADFEPVFTVTNFYDQPRAGIANYRGMPHAFDCEFDDQKDEYSDVYRLKPLEPKIFELALEQWEIWCRWEAAFHRGEARLDSHPALPHKHERYAQLITILTPELEVSEDTAIKAVGRFRSTMEVSWETVGG